jgi:hypothetical protein
MLRPDGPGVGAIGALVGTGRGIVGTMIGTAASEEGTGATGRVGGTVSCTRTDGGGIAGESVAVASFDSGSVTCDRTPGAFGVIAFSAELDEVFDGPGETRRALLTGDRLLLFAFNFVSIVQLGWMVIALSFLSLMISAMSLRFRHDSSVVSSSALRLFLFASFPNSTNWRERGFGM